MTVRRNWSDDRIDALGRRVDEGFRHVDKQFEQVDKRFEQVDRRFEGIEAGLRSLHHLMVVFGIAMVGALATALFAAVT